MFEVRKLFFSAFVQTKCSHLDSNNSLHMYANLTHPLCLHTHIYAHIKQKRFRQGTAKLLDKTERVIERRNGGARSKKR